MQRLKYCEQSMSYRSRRTDNWGVKSIENAIPKDRTRKVRAPSCQAYENILQSNERTMKISLKTKYPKGKIMGIFYLG